MAKRGNGEGSISKRSGGGWMAQYSVLSGTGGRERRTLYAKTRTEAARKLAKAIGERNTGFVVDAGRLTVGDYLERWLEDSVKGTVRTSTYEAYRYMVGPHLVPFLGALKLRDINPVHVRALYREKLEAGLSALRIMLRSPARTHSSEKSVHIHHLQRGKRTLPGSSLAHIVGQSMARLRTVS